MLKLTPDNQDLLFVTCATSVDDWLMIRRLNASLREFGGALKEVPVVVFDSGRNFIRPDQMADAGIEVRSLELSERIRHYWLSEKVVALAQAEKAYGKPNRTITWIDASCLILKPPILYRLDDGSQAAFRPVHIRNVGLALEDELDDYWHQIYQAVGIDDIVLPVDSFVDGQRLRAYFNTHAFSIKSDLGLMQRWLEIFVQLVTDASFQSGPCSEQFHRIFLFQAVLSALVVKELPSGAIRLLPDTYNYPYNLHAKVPPAKRAPSLAGLVSLTYEGRDLNPVSVVDIEVPEPYSSFLKQH
jgi:hypothetical protein